MRTNLVVISFALLSVVCGAEEMIRVVTAHAPHYPPIALAEGAADDIEVDVVVDEKGTVLDARATAGINSFLRGESEKAAMKWVFSKSGVAKREMVLHFNYVVLYPPRKAEAEIEFTMPSTVTIRQHQPETSGPSDHK
jgi:hypothetical protein